MATNYELVYIETLDNIKNQVLFSKEYDVIFEESDNLEQLFYIKKTCFNILYIQYTDDDEIIHSQQFDLDDVDTTSGNEIYKDFGDYKIGITFGDTDAESKVFVAKSISEE